MENQHTYKGINLLDLIFEFQEMTPNQDSWTISAQKENLPRLIRLKQINSLLSAFFLPDKAESFIDKAKNLFSFNHKETIQTIITGEFLDRQNISEFSELIKHISTIVGKTKNFNLINEKQIFEYEVNEIKTRDLISPYQELIKYRKYMRKLLKFNAGYLEVNSIPSLFSINLTNSISDNFKGGFAELDKTLELFINPKKLLFTKNELIEKYQFPSENLSQIDAEYW